MGEVGTEDELGAADELGTEDDLGAGDAAPPILEVDGLTKRFAGIVALDGVHVDVGTGRIVGLVGPNGAGKTTLFDCIAGVLRPDRGTVRFRGTRIDHLAVHARARLGMGRTFQRMELFQHMSPREHLLVAARAHDRGANLLRDVFARSRWTSAELEVAARTLDLVGLAALGDVPVDALSLGHGRLVELGRALVCDPTLLLLDEPSSGLDTVESAALARVIEDVRARRSCAVLIVEHDVALVRRIAEVVTVLDFGKVLATGPAEEVLELEEVRRAYMGGVL